MEENLIKLLFLLFGLYAGVMSWLFKNVYSELKELVKDHENLKLKIAELRGSILSDVDVKFDAFLGQLDTKLDSWWAKIENNLMNEGRIAPKRTKKEI